MLGRKKEDSVAVITFAEIETTNAFEGKLLRAIWRPRGVNGLCTSVVGSTEEM
jgi:hypothetical protein